MVPDAKIAYAHGQMDREQISEIWSSLIMGETDVLISTTIIETGVDIPNANTLIIEHADKMGLAQLHQIRGRIGRLQPPRVCVFHISERNSSLGYCRKKT